MDYRISEINQRIDVPVSTIRHWQEEFSEFVPVEKKEGGQRRYSEDDVEFFLRLKELLHFQQKTVEQAKQILKTDLLEPAKIDWTQQSILLTGGSGSFGRHFCKVMLEKYNPEVIRVYSRDELKHEEMRRQFGDRKLRYFVGDVRDEKRLLRAMSGVDIVVHAAALKQVPSCEYNPFEAVKTNVIGAQNIIEAAIDANVKKVIALSTDKAVNPVNLYGATKLCAEKIFVQGNAYSGKKNVRFSCVRYGNVIGSRGSVIPLFVEQKQNGVITITDQRMTRFFITLDQAVNFVIQGLERMRGGEIFIPKMPSMRLIDVVRAVAPDCTVQFIGIRPGEKLHEILITEEDGRKTILYDDLFVILPQFSWCDKLRYRSSRAAPEGFVYASHTNSDWLTVEAFREIIASACEDKRSSSAPAIRPAHSAALTARA